MGAKISKSIDRRKGQATTGHLTTASVSSHNNTPQEPQPSPIPLPTSTTEPPPTMDAANASSNPSDDPPAPANVQQDVAMDDNSTPAVDAALPPPPPPQVITPMKKPPQLCIICAEEVGADKPNGAVMHPCRSCSSNYCKGCVRDMFLTACKNTTRMPPKCCNILQLHVALPMLTPDEAKLYREKYEEWSTPNPMYCPVPTCSAFISNRLLPAIQPEKKKKKDKGKERVDSVVGTPKDAHVSCPKCTVEACIKCRQPAHPGHPCQALEFGVDAETAAALQRWGYKQCPKCGNGVRRMMGCNHMQCLCGSQWCWWCLVPMSECDGDCYGPDRENDDLDADAVEELEREREKAALEAPDATPLVPLVVAGMANGQHINLDIASAEYWDARGTTFGREPAEEPPDRAWSCQHHFETAEIDFEQSLKDAYRVTGMECTRCWSTVYPEISLPQKMSNPGGVRMAGGFRGGESRTRSRDRGPRHEHTHGRARTPLGTGRRATGMHQPLDLAVGGHVVVNTSANGNSLAPPQVIVDECGDVIMAGSDSYTVQRSMSIPGDSGFASLYQPMTTKNDFTQLSTSAPQKTEFTFRSEIAYPPFSFAAECSYCGIILCEPCKDTVVKEAAAKLAAEAEAAEAAEAEASEAAEVAQAALAANEEVVQNVVPEPTTSNTEVAVPVSAEVINTETPVEANGTQAQPTVSESTATPAVLPPADLTLEQTDKEPSVAVERSNIPSSSLDYL